MELLATRIRLLIAFIACVASAQSVHAALPVREVAPGVFVHSGKPLALDVPGHDDIANIGFVVGSRCVAVIDTGGSIRVGRALRASVREKSALPICFVIDTHIHVDHVLGNAAFSTDHPHFVGSAKLPGAITRSREFFLKNYAADFDAPASAQQIIAPDQIVDDTRDIDLGGRTLTLRAWPAAHTDCDLTVLDSASKTLWTGDLLVVGRIPSLDGSLKGWLAAIDELRTTHPEHVVPGHGPVGTNLPSMLVAETRYLRVLDAGVRAAIANGESLPDAEHEVAQSERTHWLLFDAENPRNVSRAYQELEWE